MELHLLGGGLRLKGREDLDCFEVLAVDEGKGPLAAPLFLL